MNDICGTYRLTQPRLGYTYVETDNGSVAIDEETGEVLPLNILYVPAGSHVFTPQAQRRNAEYKEQRRQFFKLKEQAAELGKFTFVSTFNDFRDLSPTTFTRLIYLSTYLRYNDSGLYRKGKPITRACLHEVLKISYRQAQRFINEVGEYLHYDDNGRLYLNNSNFVFGNLCRAEKHDAYQKLYIDSVRKLYESTPKSKHKRLGYIFLMLPYINQEHNVLCYDIYERELSKVDTMSVAEFCDIIGYSVDNIQRLLNEYANITFPVDGHEEQFCAFVSNGRNLTDAQIFVNPHVIYNGSQEHLFEILSIFCKTH